MRWKVTGKDNLVYELIAGGEFALNGGRDLHMMLRSSTITELNYKEEYNE
jgi:hypothetical protein